MTDMDERKQSHRYTDEDILEAVHSVKTATTTSVADELNCTRPAADYRLRRLRDEGRVEATMVGNTLVWRLR